MVYIERKLEKKVLKYLNKREIIAIVGPRQCGKTTLMKRIFENLKEAKFITFEDRAILELFTKDIKSFIEMYVKKHKYLFIDEFQYAKNGGENLKLIYDEHNTKIVISGSSAPDLTINSIKYLVGRIFVFTLYPLSFEEFMSYKNKELSELYKKNPSEQIIKMTNEHYREFIIYGGYPRVVLSKDKAEKVEVLKNIYNTYFLREIKEILQIQEDFKLSNLIKILALQVGGIVNYNELSSSTGFKYPELIKNINILKKTFICLDSKPYFTNKKKELVKAPKIFFLDNGFRNIVINNFQEINTRTDEGMLNENFVASEIIKKDFELKYWRTKVGAEVDFILEKEGKILPIESKSSIKESKITRGFRSFIEEYSPEKGFVLSYEHTNKIDVSKSEIIFSPLFLVSEIIE